MSTIGADLTKWVARAPMIDDHKSKDPFEA